MVQLAYYGSLSDSNFLKTCRSLNWRAMGVHLYMYVCICLHKGPAVLPGTSMHNRTFSDMIIHDQDFQEASYETP